MRLSNKGDSVVGKKLIALGRKIDLIRPISSTSAHRSQRANIRGKPAVCYVDIPLSDLL